MLGSNPELVSWIEIGTVYYKVGPGKPVLTMGPPKPTFLEVFMVNNLVFRWPKPIFFMGLGAHGISKVK